VKPLPFYNEVFIVGKFLIPISVKSFFNKEGVSNRVTFSANDVYLSGLNTPRDELAALRANEPALNEMEQTSIRALVAYTAHDKGVNEEVVHTLVETRFGVDDFSKIHGSDYEEAVRYLVDLNPKEIMN